MTTLEPLPPPPPGLTTADQARAMGLAVGDKLRGIAYDYDGHHEALIEVLWIGAQVVVFRVQCRYGEQAAWEEPYECGSWSLSFRPWARIRP
jgi:hypothetical protein